MTPTEVFCRQVRARSLENAGAVELLYRAGLWGPLIGVIRQELDSMVRVIYLLSTEDAGRRAELVADSIEGREWRKQGGRGRITDREMAERANALEGWTLSVYRFGCAFIHLSGHHDYAQRDPMRLIAPDERDAILEHMRHYHHGPLEHDPTFNDLLPYLPAVFDKVSGNLACYLRDLENGETIGET